MLASFLILFRESLEAIFVVTIVMSVIDRLKRNDLRIHVWAGIFSAIVCSILAGGALRIIMHNLTGTQEAVFQGMLLITACIMLTYVMVWFNLQIKLSNNKFEERTIHVISENQSWRIFALVFVAILREGIEIVIFSSAALVSQGRNEFVMGGISGMLCAFIAGYMIYKSSLKITAKYFFTVTSIILILVAAGFLSQGIKQLQILHILPNWGLVTFNLDSLLSDKTGPGLVLHMLFGYDSNPSLFMLISYLSYVLAAILLKQWWIEHALNKLAQRND